MMDRKLNSIHTKDARQGDFSNVGAGTTILSAGVVGGTLADLPCHGIPDLINAL